MKVNFLARPRLVFLTERKLQFILGAVLFFVCGCSGRTTVGLNENGRLVATVDNTAPITGTTSTVIAGPTGQTPPPRVAQPTPNQSEEILIPNTLTGERLEACWNELISALRANRWDDVYLLAIRFGRLAGRMAEEQLSGKAETPHVESGKDHSELEAVKSRAEAALAEMDGRR